MGRALFYQVTRTPLEAVLPALIDRALGQGWRVVLRGRDPGVMERLDRVLWQGAESFLPHGMEGGPHDADQPVLLTTGRGIANGARCMMSVDGAEVTAEEAAALERVCLLFDGADAAAVERARAQWRSLTALGLAAEYWVQSDTGWSRQAVSAPA